MTNGGSVLIVGGGVAGLTCARVLGDADVRTTLFESSDRIGGRLGSERVDGFTLELGFQVFLTDYPEAKRLLDYKSLDFKAFTPGAIVRHGGQFHRFVDPRRRPAEVLATALSPLATLGDKVRSAFAAGRVGAGNLPHVSTIERLRGLGFSDTIIERFFRPFFAGVFLENELATSSRMFDFTFQRFAGGDSVIPAGGMQAIADQLAGSIKHGEIVTGCRIQAIAGRSVSFAGGGRASGPAVVVATDANTAASLLPGVPMPRKDGWTGVTGIYYVADRSPVGEPILVLNADGGPINNIAVLSDISPAHAPAGKSLILVSVVGDHADIEPAVRQQLVDWYGPVAGTWRHLKTMRIPHALPDKSVAAMAEPHRPPRVGDGVYLCGDHCDMASIDGAMCSGRRAAEAILADGVAAARG